MSSFLSASLTHVARGNDIAVKKLTTVYVYPV